MRLCLLLGLLLGSGLALAEPNLTLMTVTDNAAGGADYTLSIKMLIFMTLLSLLPAALMMMTSFTRVIIVLSLLRQAIGTAQTPSNQVLIGLSLFLTLFIMSPVVTEIYDNAIEPYLEERLELEDAVMEAKDPLFEFMLSHTREKDLALFLGLADIDLVDEPSQVPFHVLVPAFVTSELMTAFQIGFLVFIPFLIIDLVVASVLMSMGMMMLSPVIVSFPFKIMLFVVVDGWTLVIGMLAASFQV